MTDQLTLAVGDNGGFDINKIRECVAYSPSSPTGLVWIKSSGRVKAGDHAGSYNSARGYYYVTINKKKYLAHRVIWVLMHGSLGSSVDVDHKALIRPAVWQALNVFPLLWLAVICRFLVSNPLADC